jgi:pullulanase/glycogen debranching enzyme
MKRSYSRETPGFTLTENSTEFCFYCPSAEKVECVLFSRFDDEQGQTHPMTRNARGYWHLQLPARLTGKWYGYRVNFGENPPHPPSPYEGKLFADPYSRHVTVLNDYRQQAKSYIFEDDFDWQGTGHCFPDDPRDLIIYETHLKDLTAHPSSKAQQPGFYRKFVESGQEGGLPYLKRLGVNCVEFLPLQKFSPLEPPFGKKPMKGFTTHGTCTPPITGAT